MNVHSIAGMIEAMRPLIAAGLWDEMARFVSLREGKFRFAWEELSPVARDLAQANLASNPHACANVYCTARLLKDGPKVFRPTAEQAEALEQVEVGVPMEAYRQPFPCMAVEFPADWRSRRAVPDGDGSVTHEPFAVLLAHESAEQAIVVTVLFTSGHAISEVLRGDSVEDALQEAERAGATGDRSMSAAENRLSTRAIRAALNALLLLTHYGSKQQEPDNPSHARRLQARLDKAKRGKGKGDVLAASRDLRLLPVVYGFSQQVTLHDRQEAHQGEGAPTGKTVKPHWRRGHWRNARVGAGRAATKLTFVRPCLIHAERVAGPLSSTSTTYVP